MSKDNFSEQDAPKEKEWRWLLRDSVRQALYSDGGYRLVRV